MSPASRWSRNCTPLTTRPSLTSRQGMILRAGKGQRLLERETAFPQRLADNRAVGAETPQVLDAGNAARRLDAEARQALDGFIEQAEIRSAQHAVAADVGQQQVPRLGIERGDVPKRQPAVFG